MRAVRVVFDHHRDGDWHLSTSDLTELTDVLGADVLTAFCTCFIHADRIVSLVSMFHGSRRRFKKGSLGERRNFLTFATFLVGTLKELGENLKRLSAALHKQGLLDAQGWKNGLGRWQKWGLSGPASTVRKKLSFHVDAEIVAKGLRSLAASTDRHDLMRGPTNKLRDCSFVLAQDASLRGIELTLGGLNVLGDPAHFINLSEALDAEFLRVLNAVGLKPIFVRSSGRKVGLSKT